MRSLAACGISACFLGLTAAAAGAQNAALAIPREISVAAQVKAFIEPDTVRITVLLEETGAKAEEARAAVEETAGRVESALQAVEPGLSMQLRGEQLSGAGGNQQAVTQTAAVRAQRFLAVETGGTAKAAALIDAALSAGAKEISGTEYFISKQRPEHLAAVREAAERARKKAELLAQSLGVSLGELLSASITEQPAGAILRLNNQAGRDASRYSEEELHITANLRFALE